MGAAWRRMGRSAKHEAKPTQRTDARKNFSLASLALAGDDTYAANKGGGLIERAAAGPYPVPTPRCLVGTLRLVYTYYFAHPTTHF